MKFRILFIFFLAILGFNCSHKPYQPNYNQQTSHNNTIKSRSAIIDRQSRQEIRRSNLQRKRARKDRKVKKLNKKANKYSRKLVK
jgi:uncharacterized protein YlxW (UPF0749 family)